jgi:hypothetical protein
MHGEGRRRVHTRTVSLPFYRWHLSTARPIPGYPEEIRHIGHQLLKRRLDLGMQQRRAARILGTGAWNLRNWESGRHKIEIRFYPAIIEFLGFARSPLRPPRRSRSVEHG